MERLTEKLGPPLTFRSCQLDGYTSDDICEFRMWQECDESDQPEPGKVIITCRKELGNPCTKQLEEHPRLYKEVLWGRGLPGWSILICENCKYRYKTSCIHSSLRANSGTGLEVYLASPLGLNTTICFTNRVCLQGQDLAPITSCKGYKEKGS